MPLNQGLRPHFPELGRRDTQIKWPQTEAAQRIKPRPDAASATKQDALAGLVAAGAQALALPIDPAWEPA